MSEQKKIEIIDSGEARYCLNPNFEVLGRMWDNEAEEVVVVKPDNESESLCVMIVTADGKVVDHIVIDDEPVKITSNLSQYASVKIGFSFSRVDGYVKNSETAKFYFLNAQKPDGFVPVEPEQMVIIEQLAEHGFVRAELQNNELVFFTANGNETQRVQLSGFVQEQSDLGEIDQTKETFIKGKRTSNLENDGDGTSPFATQEYVGLHTPEIDTSNLVTKIEFSELKLNSVLSLDSTQMDNYLAEGGLTQGQLAVCKKVITNGYDEGATYRFDISDPDTYSWTKVSYSKAEIDGIVGTINTELENILGV